MKDIIEAMKKVKEFCEVNYCGGCPIQDMDNENECCDDSPACWKIKEPPKNLEVKLKVTGAYEIEKAVDNLKDALDNLRVEVDG